MKFSPGQFSFVGNQIYQSLLIQKGDEGLITDLLFV